MQMNDKIILVLIADLCNNLIDEDSKVNEMNKLRKRMRRLGYYNQFTDINREED